MANGNQLHLNYIKEYLIPEILSKFEAETLEDFKVEHSGGLDGFMSALYNIHLTIKTSAGLKERLLIAKFMKGDTDFRESSKSYIQFANEVFIYSKVLPSYQQLLQDGKVTSVSVDDWVASSFVAKFGYVEGLSVSPSSREAVLVLENLKPLGYALGPRQYLSYNQLLGMCKPLAEYHALGYALKVCNETQFESLKNEIISLPFINDNNSLDEKNNLYRPVYRVAFDRFFDYFDRILNSSTFDKSSANDVKLIRLLGSVREKYFAEPTRLLERIRTKVEERDEDRMFGAILHGDYNRNNVLFRRREPEQQEGGQQVLTEVQDVKMIDFQELRFGSPALDLSFFMYINSDESIRADHWLDLLQAYHAQMVTTLKTVLKAHKKPQEVESQLEHFSFEKFNKHFGRYAFYGVVICMHFLPWLVCSEDVCERLAHAFETDMHGEDFYRTSFVAGGDEANLKILDIMRHACSMGYMDDI